MRHRAQRERRFAHYVIAGATTALLVTATAATYYVVAPDTVNEQSTITSLNHPPAPPCSDDMLCWDCTLMGNLTCGDGTGAPMDWMPYQEFQCEDFVYAWDPETHAWLPALPMEC